MNFLLRRSSSSAPAAGNNVVSVLSLLLLLVILPSAFTSTSADSQNERHNQERIPLIFSGALLSQTSKPIPSAAIQIWQTHPDSGLYNHPSSAGSNIDGTFQYFGTSTTDNDGKFEFVTYKPAPFTTRPPHIHFKVWLPAEDGQQRSNVLTSQFYFTEDGTQASDMLLLELDEVSDTDGNPALMTSKTVVVNVAGGGTADTSSTIEQLQVTPTQAEGPFYPVVDFFALDGDLTSVVAVDDSVQTEEVAGDASEEETGTEDGSVANGAVDVETGDASEEETDTEEKGVANGTVDLVDMSSTSAMSSLSSEPSSAASAIPVSILPVSVLTIAVAFLFQ
eukprot:CAMPEP_0178514344 /NCGR_PEP_ID=MMETSP0696-20121128/23967_1 /TAXON_ID=265572 /ORGANISM="Extubocellulus spinifer, Strain CCMP396" /LENGTH=335 /DNA_ID=CAMNT_0020144421 /DNA_START=144 /DNA_END=1151 /DNA_ORIENTATION=-